MAIAHTADRRKVYLIWFTPPFLSIQVDGKTMSKESVFCPPPHVVFSFWLRLLSVASGWRWTAGCWRRFFCWSLRRRCLGLTGNATASRTQPIWRLKYQDLRRGEMLMVRKGSHVYNILSNTSKWRFKVSFLHTEWIFTQRYSWWCLGEMI